MAEKAKAVPGARMMSFSPGRRRQVALTLVLVACTTLATLGWGRYGGGALWLFAWVFLFFFSTWHVLLCGCAFPPPASRRWLLHSTPAWDAIASSGCLLPTADARIYLTQTDQVLGQGDAHGANTRIVFLHAQQRKLAVPANYGWLHYLRFKLGRGEWLAPPHQRLRLLRYRVLGQCCTVIVTRYRLEALPPAASRMLRWRVRLASLMLCIPLLCALGGLLAVDLYVHAGQRPLFGMYVEPAAPYACLSPYLLLSYFVLLYAGYRLQHVFNARYFAAALAP
jgi:hypothetical protein